MADYDLIVIGSGTAAQVAASIVRNAGRTVAVIDHRPFGGTCALRGCDPKKMLIGGAAAVDHVRRMDGKGVAGSAYIDWPKLLAFKRTFTGPIPGKQEQRYREKGVDGYHGPARFTGPNSVEVAGQRLNGRHLLIAAGAEPIRLGIPGEEYLTTSEEFLELETLPRRIVLVGGGYIAAEFSHIAARAGAQVTILHRDERMLTRFDPDLVGWLMEKFRQIGIDVRLRTEVVEIEKTSTGLLVHALSPERRDSIEADLVIHSAGRAPALDVLNLEAAGIDSVHGRLKLNEYLQSTSNPSVYAAGDAAQSGPPLTPVSSHDAKVVAANILEGNHLHPNYSGVPSVAFTVPPIAAVGLSEEEAREKKLAFRVKTLKASNWFTARQAAEETYGFKVIAEDETGRILGAHLVGPHAEEVINIFGLAIRHGLTVGDLKTTMFAYPTVASDIGSML